MEQLFGTGKSRPIHSNMGERRRLTLRLGHHYQPGLFVALFLIGASATAEIKTAPIPVLMPRPAHVALSDGKLAIDGSFSVNVSGCSGAASAVGRFVTQVSRQTGLPVAGGGRAALVIECRSDAKY